jgi:hypothetical protein
MVWERAESGVLRRKRALHGAQSVGVAQVRRVQAPRP